ncbi:putative secreted protein with PEP-CTERM sorting signal [Pseudoduganella lurida]|uniref:Putative secreted protein with PEP-CTERM sorting signal n=1 Tax=Pseudoduganella lurida TaxID=1036180 RepID=A0A562R7U5_9BURK|nr:FxDxF family PEP-CTERM protein [Pseudoduganella lurida]TWI65131.1 putative secreted protein with PEP-CTERM sorting signal [Pseudoduganella lurida]
MKLASLITAALLLAAPAVYAAHDISAPAKTVAAVQTEDLSFSLGTTFRTASVGDFFSNRYNFTLASDTYLDANITSNSVDLTGFGLYNALNGGLLLGGTQSVSRGVEKYTLTLDSLGAGSYYFLASGTILKSGASFAGNGVFEVAALPVPEPTTYAMLLGGMAILGAAARRQRQ